MSNRYVNVTITRQTQAVSRAGFGMALILSTEQDAEYREYTDISQVGSDFGTDSETYRLASAIFGQSPRPSKVAIYGYEYDTEREENPDTPAALSGVLNQLIKNNNGFFYLVSTDQTDPVINELARWTATQSKLYFASTSNIDLPKNINQTNTVILVHDEPKTYPAEAWVGVGAPLDVGSFTWTFKTLNGIKPTSFDTSVVDRIEENNGSAYIREGGVDITSKGVTTSGEYIDIIQSQYFLTSRMTENVFGLLARTAKVPFTDAGIAMVVAEVENTLKSAANQGIIAEDADGNPMYSIEAPTRAEVSVNDRANRVLPGVRWKATIAGAVEDVDINGVLEV